jgi:ABC-type polysaccharide/polyol phosphate export permease
MYLTPVIYPLRIIPERFKPLILMNPLTYFVDAARLPLYEGRLPTAGDFAIPVAVAVIAAIGGWMVFRRLARGFYPYL